MSTRTGSARFGRVALVGVVGWIVRRFRRVRVPDPYRPIFDPGLDIATVVFSHVRCVKTRHSLARVSKLWRDASKPAAAYPLRFDIDEFPDYSSHRFTRRIDMMDNDEALSLPYERVVGLLGKVGWYYVWDYAAELGSVRLLKWARVNNLPWSRQTCKYAAANGQLPALKYLHENGCPWDSNTCLYAALNGHLSVLQYLHENGCPWTSDTCSYAAQNGHLSVLQYLHENGCPWDSDTCSAAASIGDLSALKYLHENGCPWDSYSICSSAARHGHLPALQYLHENQCPWSSSTCYHAAHYKRWDCLQYAVDNKCPRWEGYADKHAEHLR